MRWSCCVERFINDSLFVFGLSIHQEVPMEKVVGDLVFVRGSRVLNQIPLIIVDIQSFQDGVDYIVLDPQTGNRYAYQRHDLTDGP